MKLHQDIVRVSRFISEGFVNYFSMADQRSYQVITQVPNENRNSWDDLKNYRIRSNTGEMVPLASLIECESVQPSKNWINSSS
ncbi:efflux RND transporter permease subunit [Vibrio lentus]|nr:efflux RND transporter permease subunit [Vibrio lentus]